MPKKPTGSMLTSIVALVTALVPLIMQLTSNTDKKIDVSYDLLKQKTEFQDKEISALRDDIKAIHNYLLQTTKELNNRRYYSSVITAPPTVAHPASRSTTRTASTGRRAGSARSLTPPEALFKSDKKKGEEDLALPEPPKTQQVAQQQITLPSKLQDVL